MPYLYIYPIPPKSSRIKFTGYIVPKILEISLAVPRTGWTWPEVGIDVTFELSIVNGDISVICYASDFDKEKLFFPLILRTHDIVRTALNLTTFSSGFGFTFILDEATFPDGTKNKLMIQEPALATLSTSTEKQVDYDTVMKIALQELPVARALHDLIDSITVFHAAQTACLRAIETLRNHMVPDTKNRERQWKIFRQNLRIQRTYLEPITKLSVGPRHGDPIYVPDIEIKNIQERAWTIVNRYFEFRKLGGREPLPLILFPYLA